MRRKLLVAVAILAATDAACSRAKRAEARPVPEGDAIWLRDGTGAATTGLEEALLRAGFSAVYLPGPTLRAEAGAITASARDLPSSPLNRIPVVLVLGGGEGLETSLRTAAGPGLEALATSLGNVVAAALAERPRYGKVAGVHLELPFSSPTLAGFRKLVAEVRRRLPAPYRLTASLGFSPGEDDRDRLGEVAVDAWTVNVFGEPGSADPLAVDSLGKPWFAVYTPGARGVWRGADNAVKGKLGEGHLALLSDRPDVDFTHDLTWKEEWSSGFLLRPRRAVETPGASFAPGDVISFSQPSLPEMLSLLGADVAAKRNARGRIIVLEGTSDSDRIFSLAALADVLLGRALDPDLRVTIAPAPPSQVRVGALNAGPHVSVVSRTANWVEIELPTPGVRDVQSGGFERYEVYDAAERPVTLGRARRVRLFETLLGPSERVEDARITLRGAPPKGCCRWRSRMVSAAGREIVTDWVAPEPVFTPAPTPGAVGRPARTGPGERSGLVHQL